METQQKTIPTDSTVYLTPWKTTAETSESSRRLLEAQGFALPAPETMDGGAGGGGMVMRVGQNIIGGDGGGAGVAFDGANYRVETAGSGGGGALFGRIVYENNFLRVYPLVGFGGMGETVEVESPAGQPLLKVNYGGVMFRLGIGAEARLKLFGRFGVMAGVRAGVMLVPFTSSWQGEGADQLPDPQAIRRIQPFVQFIFGATMTG